MVKTFTHVVWISSYQSPPPQLYKVEISIVFTLQVKKLYYFAKAPNSKKGS